MKKRFFLFGLLLSFIAIGCNNQKDNDESQGKRDTVSKSITVKKIHDGFSLSGEIAGGAGKRLWVEEIGPKETMFIDSVQIDSAGHFEFQFQPSYRSLFALHVTPENYIVFLPDNGETIELDGQWDSLSLTYTIQGSRESLLLWQLQEFYNEGARVLRDIVDTANHYDDLLKRKKITKKQYDAKRKESNDIYRDAFLEQQDYICRFIEENKGSLATLIALYKDFNHRPLIDARDPGSIDYYDLVLQGLQQTLPDNPHTLYFKNTTEHLRSALARQEEGRGER